MTDKPFSNLTLAEQERLHMLIEEHAEVIQCLTKILRHGWENYNPDDNMSTTNRGDLYREMHDIHAIETAMYKSGDIGLNIYNGLGSNLQTWRKKLRYAHHQEDDFPVKSWGLK